MSQINIKIMGTDPLSKQVLVACNTDLSVKGLEEQPLRAFPHDFGGASTPEEFLVNIQTACRQIAFDQDLVANKDFSADGWVGVETTYTPPVEDTTTAEYNAKKLAVYASYPAANMDSINQILAIQYNNMILKPLISYSDAAVIGIVVEAYSSSTLGGGIEAFKSLKECTELCIDLGVPMCGGTTPKSGVTRDKIEAYLASISQYNRFIGTPSESYVYQDWTLDYAQKRKKTLINTDRNREIASGITFAGFEWDSDDTSRNNLTNFIASSGQTEGVWRTKGNQNVTVDLVGLSKALADHVTTCFEKSWTRKEALKSTTSFGEVDAI